MYRFKQTWVLHAMLAPAVILIFLFQYLPMMGIIMAFQEYKPWLGILNSPWIGFGHFRYLFSDPKSLQVIWNTFLIASLKILFGLAVPVLFALLLNEIRLIRVKKLIQTFVYLPHFLSWVVLGGILIDMLSINNGIVNRGLGALGIESIFFLGTGTWFRFTVVLSDIWKTFGFSAIIFLAALAGIDQNLYEAAEVDGAGRFKQTIHITIPSIAPIIVVVSVLSLGNILNAGFDQIFNLYNPLVYDKGDIIDTFVYRVGLVQGSYSFGTAVGFFKSTVAFLLITGTYRLAYKYADYRIF